MRLLTLSIAVLALAACQKTETATTTTNTVTNTTETNVVDATMTNAAAPAPALTTLNETTWQYKSKDGKDLEQSVDASGNFITTSGKEHIDHGTAVLKGGKGCFTSAMTKDGEVCWTDPLIAEGASGVTVSDKGEKLPIKRVAYIPHTM